jgi:hypothetical protein
VDFFAAFSLLVAGGFLMAGFLRQRTLDPAAYRKGLTLLVAGLILYYPVSALFTIGLYLSFVARPVGFVLGVLSFRLLCLTLAATNGPGKAGGAGDA